MGKNEWEEPAPGSAGDRLANWYQYIRDEQRRNSPQARRRRSKEHLAGIAQPPKAQVVELEQTGAPTAWLYLTICVLFDVANASAWVAQARRYIAAHRALDEVESAALLTGPTPAA